MDGVTVRKSANAVSPAQVRARSNPFPTIDNRPPVLRRCLRSPGEHGRVYQGGAKKREPEAGKHDEQPREAHGGPPPPALTPQWCSGTKLGRAAAIGSRRFISMPLTSI